MSINLYVSDNPSYIKEGVEYHNQQTIDLTNTNANQEHESFHEILHGPSSKHRKEILGILHVELTGVSTLEGEPCNIHFRQKGPAIKNTNYVGNSTTPISLNISSARPARNCIKTGEYRVIEHINAALFLSGITQTQVVCSSRSFPSFDDSIAPYLDIFKRHGKTTQEEHRFITVKHPIAFQFDNEAYIIYLPDGNGDKELVMDTSISYPMKIPGDQRLVFQINEATGEYLSRARSNCVDFPGLAGLKYKLSDLIYKTQRYLGKQERVMGITPYNILYCSGNQYNNPNDQYTIDNGKNIEIVAHTMIDRIGEIGLLDGRLCGQVLSSKISHEQNLHALKYLTRRNLLVEV